MKHTGIAAFSTVARTYRLSAGTVKRIDHIVDQYGISPSHLVEALLQFALSEVDAGRLELLQKPVKFKLIGIERKDPEHGNGE